jgi:hypothetical protein
MTITKQTVKEQGTCNSCSTYIIATVKQEPLPYKIIYNFELQGLTFRLCPSCLEELKKRLKTI